MYGTVISSLSSEAEKCWAYSRASGVWGGWGGASGCPRWVLLRVTLCHSFAPLSVNENVTLGSPPPPPPAKFCSGLVMSVPLSDGLSLRTYQRSGLPFSPFFLSARTRIVPGLTLSTRVPGGWPFSEKRSPRVSSGPRRTVWVLSLTRYHWVPVVALPLFIGGRFSATLSAWYSGTPSVPAAPPPVTRGSAGWGLPSGPRTL